ncbi:GNAT family N-acetyltransferase [Streptomyces sp. NPDC020379]|uniref:GNAT family N-acetyltransferase n=1 Tax=Streptomyces sp. NPDC020379 TaxID=3365071 RepID=UPI003797A927
MSPTSCCARGGRGSRCRTAGNGGPEFRRWNAITVPPPDEEGARAFLGSRTDGWRQGDSVGFAVTARAEGPDAAVGSVGLSMIDHIRRNARVSYWILPEFRGRGYASRALEALTRWAFHERLRPHRLELGHALGHDASCRVAERCAYGLEGTLRGALPGGDGGMWDIRLHARLATGPEPELTARGAR